MERLANVIRIESIIELAQKFEAETCEKPILCCKENTFYKITELRIETNGEPQKVLNWYGYDMMVFPSDSALQSDNVYAYNKKQVKDAVLEYINNKCQKLLKQAQEWLIQ